MWDGLAPRIAALGHRVVAPDLRGHGDSGRLSSGHVFAATALDVALLARHLGPPVGLVGHSFGGGVAVMVHLAGVRHEVVDGAGHYVHVEQPDAVLAAIGRFLDEVNPSASGASVARAARPQAEERMT